MGIHVELPPSTTAGDIQSLPIELWNEIWSRKLTYKDLVRFSETCKVFYFIAHRVMTYLDKSRDLLRNDNIFLGSNFRKAMPVVPVLTEVPVNVWRNMNYLVQIQSVDDCAKWIPCLRQNPNIFVTMTFLEEVWEESDEDIREQAMGELIKLGCVKQIVFRNCDRLPKTLARFTSGQLILYKINMIDMDLIRTRDYVSLESCYSVTDVSALSGIHTLKLCQLGQLINVSQLRHVDTLILQNCHDIEDVSALKTVQSLTIWNCRRIENIAMLGGVKKLTLSKLPRVRDVSCLANVPQLKLIDMRGVISV